MWRNITDTLWHVKNNGETLLAQKKYQTFKVLSEKVEKDLDMNAETYDKNRMKLTINHEGNRL